jgi:maltose-binding protein MalE
MALFFVPKTGGSMSNFDVVLHAKVSEQHMSKLEAIKRMTGLTQGAVVRQAIDALRVVPAKFEVIIEADKVKNEIAQQ